MKVEEVEIAEVVEGDIVRLLGKAYLVKASVMTGSVVGLFIRPMSNYKASESLVHGEADELIEVVRDAV
jgi:hypothetical protein